MCNRRVSSVYKIKCKIKYVTEDLGEAFCSLKILSYNVWFREDLEVYKRMSAIGDIIQQHSPDLICFQVSY